MASKSKTLESQIRQGEKELLRIVAESRREIERKIADAVAQENFIKAASIRDRLYNGITAEYIALNRGVDSYINKRGKAVARAWHTLAESDIPETTAGSFTFGQFSKKYLDDIIGKINPSTAQDRIAINARLGGMLDEDIRAVRTAVSDTIRKGALTGMNNFELTKEMQKKASKIKPAFQFVDKAGKKWNSTSYFAMLNRTLHATVARETYESTAAEEGYDLFTIDGGPSSGPPDDPCNEWNGKVVSLTGKTKGYPTVQDARDAGVWHPNCTHVLGVYIEGFEEAVVKRFDDEGNKI